MEAQPQEPAAGDAAVLALRRLSRLAAAALVAGGALLVAAWAFDLPRIRTVLVGYPAALPNSALAFVVFGATLALEGAGIRHVARIVGALAVVAFGLLVLAEYVRGRDLGLDGLVFPGARSSPEFAAGRPAATVGLAFGALGLALLVLDLELENRLAPAEGLAVAAAFLAVLSLTGYVYGEASTGHPSAPPVTGIPIPTAVLLLVGALGVLCARPTRGFMAIVASPRLGGTVARRLIAGAAAIPFLGLAAAVAERRHLISRPAAEGAVAVIATAAALVLVLRTSRTVNGLDEERQRRAEELRLWKHFFDHAQFGVVARGLDLRIRLVNEAFAKMHGWTAEELAGRHIFDVVVPARREERLHDIERVRITGHERYESEHLRRDGSTFPVEIDATAVRDERGRDLYHALSIVDITARKQAEAAMAQLASIVDVAEEAIFSTTLDGIVLTWNAGAERLFGYSASEVVGHSGLFLAPPEIAREPEEKLARLRRGERISSQETVRQRKDGKRVPVLLSLSVIRDASGEPVRISGVMHDISERKAKEEALRRANAEEHRMRMLLDATGRAVREVSEIVARMPAIDLRAVFRAIAEHARTLTQAEFASLGAGGGADQPFEPWVSVGLSDADLRAIARMPKARAVLGTVTRRGGALRATNVRHSPETDGSPANGPAVTSFLAVAIRFQGRPLGNLFVANKRGGAAFTRDDQSLVELLADRTAVAIETASLYEKSERQRSWLQAVVAHLPEPMVVTDAAGKILAHSRAALSLCREGAAAGGRIRGGAAAFDLRDPATGEAMAMEDLPLQRALKTGEQVTREDLVVRLGDGRLVPVLVNAAPLRAADGRVDGAVMLFQDMTHQRELERLREEWTSLVAHDLRQPVASIRLTADVLRRTKGAGEGANEPLGRIVAASNRLGRMINDLLDASRLEAHNLNLQKRDVVLQNELRGQLARLAPIVEGHPVRVVVPEDDVHASVDADRLEQVLGNLLSNAAKYGEKGSEIVVRIEEDDGHAVLSVTNRGRGIPAEVLPRLFQRFDRGWAAGQSRIPGTGLGLYICKGLVEAHGGRIRVESTPGESTTFFVELPTGVRRTFEEPAPHA